MDNMEQLDITHEGDRKDFMTFTKEAIGQARLEVRFKKLDVNAVVPTYAHNGDVGMDLTAIDVEYDEEKDMYIYHTGLAFETDYHYGIFLFPRSSNRKTDAYLCNHVGIADSAIYRGEIILCFKNRTSLKNHALAERASAFFNAIEDGKSFDDAMHDSIVAWTNAISSRYDLAPYKVGDRIAQMVVLPYPNVSLVEANELSQSVRGANGFGSTDIKK